MPSLPTARDGTPSTGIASSDNDNDNDDVNVKVNVNVNAKPNTAKAGEGGAPNPENPRKRNRNRPRIAVLPRAVVDQIAAGEVVQRPVSVVKELLENSLDAGATRIVVQYDGLSRLSIADNGRGIRRADLELLCTRHATSKLVSVDDFSDLSTFGFRGEALASTSMVSRMLTVVSRVRVGEYGDNDDEGTNPSVAVAAYSQSYQNGKPLQKAPKPCARKVGTTITVNDLFYNVLHRQRAYSKREADEYGRIHKIVQDYAVHYPTVGFVCQRRMAAPGGRKGAAQHKQLVVDCNTGQIPAVGALLQSREAHTMAAEDTRAQNSSQKEKVVEATKQILSHVLESNLANHLLYVECSSRSEDKVPTSNNNNSGNSDNDNNCNSNNNTKEGLDRYKFRYAAEIYFTSPTYNNSGGGGKTRKGSSKQGKFILFLNHRLVDLPPLKRALEDVYAHLGNPGRNNTASNNAGKPVLVVNLRVPGCQVDVNVHPSKRQVALMHQEDLIREVAQTLKDRLEEEGQAFVAQSVATTTPTKPIIRNPYTKSSNRKRKRSSNEPSGVTEKGDDEEDDNNKDNDDQNDEGEKRSEHPTYFNSPQQQNHRGKADAEKRNIASSGKKKTAPSKLIRTNTAARAGAIEPFLVATQLSSQQSQSQSIPDDDDETDNPSSSRRPLSQQQQPPMVHVPPCPLADPSSLMSANDIDLSQPGAFATVLKRERCTCPTDVIDVARRTVFVPNSVIRPKRVVPTPSKYTSMASLRKRVGKQQCHETTRRIRKAFFMGVLSHQRSLVQCDEELVMINHFELAKELFYQLALARFRGGASLARLGGGGIDIQTVVAQALQCEDELTLRCAAKNTDGSNSNANDDNNTGGNDNPSCGGMFQVNDPNQDLAQHVTARLVESSAMLEEYFSIRIELQKSTNEGDSKNDDSNNQQSEKINEKEHNDTTGKAILTGLPVLLEGHSPQPRKLFFRNVVCLRHSSLSSY